MVALCKNRPEGFGPLSALYPHTLTSCFLDTILLPLCTWLYLLLVLVFLATSRRRTTHTHPHHKDPSRPIALDGTEPYNPAPPRKRRKAHLALTIAYTLLLVAQVLMCILEITRLALADLGIGLLPFTPLAILIAGFLHHFSPSLSPSSRYAKPRRLGRLGRWTRGVNGALWVGLMAVSVVKIVEETREGVGTRAGTKYPMSNEVVDVGLMVGLYAVLAGLEVVC